MPESRECANCGDSGDPGHHWMEGVGYVCFHKPDMNEDAPPPQGHDGTERSVESAK